MNHNQVIVESLVACLNEWDAFGYGWTIDSINEFIEKYEGVFLNSGGLFLRGLRAKVGANVQPHQTIDGVLGIVSMNIYVLRNRLIQIQAIQNQQQNNK